MNTTSTPPAHLVPWLTHVDFLTKKLHDQVGDARLHVLDQCWTSPDWWDRYVLGLTCDQVMHREILMTAWDAPCWYARTILPITTYQADSVLFDRLNSESLGNLIFHGTVIKRASIVNYAIDKQSIEYYWLNASMHQQASTLWVRLSEFKLNAIFPFFLFEILLPGLDALPKRSL